MKKAQFVKKKHFIAEDTENAEKRQRSDKSRGQRTENQTTDDRRQMTAEIRRQRAEVGGLRSEDRWQRTVKPDDGWQTTDDSKILED